MKALYKRKVCNIMSSQFKFTVDLIEPDLEARTKEEAIEKLSNNFVALGYATSNYYRLVIEREKEYPTGLVTSGANIAIPHAFDPTIKGTHVAIGILKNPVLFDNMENFDEKISVEIIFMLAISEAKEQLEMLQILMSIFKSKDLLREIKKKNQKRIYVLN